MANPATHPQLANAATKVAYMSHLIKSYTDWNDGKSKFIFTTNRSLSERVEKPTYFPQNATEFIKYWNEKLMWQKREVLLYLANLSKKTYVNKDDFAAIKKAYEKWPKDHHALFYGNDYAWSCNMLVGEALYLSG